MSLLLRFGRGHVQISVPENPPLQSRLCFEQIIARPFLKWAGGKQWLSPIARGIVPEVFSGRYFEPFLGGGALFFALAPPRAILSDSNPDLVAAYQSVQKDLEGVIALLATYPHDREFFLKLRADRPTQLASRGARVIYLNKTAFNGMYRVNRAGAFNVPFGNYASPGICQPDRLTAASSALRQARLGCRDFEVTLRAARTGDLVYLDPPYITGHHNNGFRKYNADIFEWSSQERLSAAVTRLSARGVYVLMSNADHPAIRRLYPDLTITQIERRSLINANPQARGTVAEALYSNYSLSPERIAQAAEGRK